MDKAKFDDKWGSGLNSICTVSDHKPSHCGHLGEFGRDRNCNRSVSAIEDALVVDRVHLVKGFANQRDGLIQSQVFIIYTCTYLHDIPWLRGINGSLDRCVIGGHFYHSASCSLAEDLNCTDGDYSDQRNEYCHNDDGTKV